MTACLARRGARQRSRQHTPLCSARAALVVFALALLSCGGAPEPVAPGDTRAPATAAPPAPTHDAHARAANAEELELVQELMRDTEQLRGLRFIQPVRVTIEDHVGMRAYVERAIREDQLERARLRYLALGVLDPALDIRELLVALMEEELIGYYDPDERRLAVRADIARALGREDARSNRSAMWRATVVHELVHALQDQHFQIGAAMHDERTTDADNAFAALVEGDATLVMLGYTLASSGESLASLAAQPARVRALMARPPEQLTGALRNAPALVREPLLFRYREGAAFCAALFRNGGWSAVDAAQRALPKSSQSIRLPERYLARAPEPTLALPEPLPTLADHALERLDDDTLGALELSIVLQASELETARLVEAWRGDRYVVLRRDDALGSLWWLRFADARSARAAAVLFERLTPTRRIARRAELLLVAHGLGAEVFDDALRQLQNSAFRAPQRSRAHAQTRATKRATPLATMSHGH